MSFDFDDVIVTEDGEIIVCNSKMPIDPEIEKKIIMAELKDSLKAEEELNYIIDKKYGFDEKLDKKDKVVVDDKETNDDKELG